MIGGIQGYSSYNNFGIGNYSGNYGTVGVGRTDNAEDVAGVNPGRRSSPAECKTCRERKYQDGSNENVSFKAATHISPRAAASAVRAHEGEHVANAYSKAAENNGKVVRASVSIHTAVCPECGTTYVSGGTTDTVIKYDKEDNPYRKNLKSAEGSILLGANFDAAV